MTALELTTPTQGRKVNAAAAFEPQVAGATSSDPDVREELNPIVARWVTRPPDRCQAQVAVGAPV